MEVTMPVNTWGRHTSFGFLELLLKDYQAGVPAVRQLLNQRTVYFLPAVILMTEYDIQNDRYKYWEKSSQSEFQHLRGRPQSQPCTFGEQEDPAKIQKAKHHGPQPSEPETIAEKILSSPTRILKLLLSFHTFSKLILLSMGTYLQHCWNPKDQKFFQTMAKPWQVGMDIMPQVPGTSIL